MMLSINAEAKRRKEGFRGFPSPGASSLLAAGISSSGHGAAWSLPCNQVALGRPFPGQCRG